MSKSIRIRLFRQRFRIRGGGARQQAGATSMRTRRGRGRGARADCGEHLVFERRPDDRSFIPDPHLFVLKYLNWGGGGGAGKKGMHVVCGKCVFTYAAILCGWRFRAVGIVLKKNRVAVLPFSCGGACMFTYIRVGAVLTFSCGGRCMFTYIRLGALALGWLS